MATAGGPNIERDGLIFGMDTSYGIDTNSISSRFYPGMPTTNLVPISLSNSLWFNEYSSGRTLQPYTLFGQPAYEFKSNDGLIYVSPFAFNSYDRSTNDLTLSVYAKNIGSSAVSMNTYFGGDYSTDSLGNSNYKSLPADNTWRRYSWTRFSSAMVANYLEFRTANTGVVISCPQLEIGRIVSTLIDGSRSSTQSLIDLTKTTDIDVSNVSFDSTGQPTFDGTDDYINLPNSLATTLNGNSEASINMWIKLNNQSNGVGDTGLIQLSNYNSSNGNLYFYSNGYTYLDIFRTSRVETVFANNTVTATDWHMLTITTTPGANGWKCYINGEFKSSTTGQDTVSVNSSIQGGLTLGRNSSSRYTNGNIAVCAIYDRALSADEVQQNYKAYKNRFNL